METKTLAFEGLSIELPTLSEDLPLDIVEKFEDDKIVAFVRALVGDENWVKFKSTKPSMKDFGRLADAIGGVYGFESVGESSGSGDSSKSTAEPLPPTSKPSTDWISKEKSNAP